MSSRSGFMTRLSKSTRITFFSCVGFVALTCLILVFFILFPITPSEKIMASIGRENVLNGGSGGSPQSITPGVVTTSADEAGGGEDEVTTKPVSTTTRTVNIKITTGSGFLWNGRIPTGVMPGQSYPTTPVDDDPIIPTPDPGITGGGTTQTPQPPVDDPPVDNPQPPVDNPDTPPVDNPDPPPVDNPDPPPVDNPDPPPIDNPDPNGGGGGGDSGEPSPDPAV